MVKLRKPAPKPPDLSWALCCSWNEKTGCKATSKLREKNGEQLLTFSPKTAETPQIATLTRERPLEVPQCRGIFDSLQTKTEGRKRKNSDGRIR